MSPFDKIFRRNSRQVDAAEVPSNKGEGNNAFPSEALPPPPEGAPEDESTAQQRAAAAPAPAPAFNRPNPAAGPGPTPHYQVPAQNAGMLAGAVVGSGSGGGGMGADMAMGATVGAVVGQRLEQAQKHAYWRDQALDYREQLAAGAPPLSEQVEAAEAASGKRASWWSKEGRELRRLKRWERRAARRDGA